MKNEKSRLNLTDIMPATSSFEYYDTKDSQLLVVNLPNTLKISITVPHRVFEWFVDIYNSQGQKLISNWYDYYSDTEENLTREMEGEVKDFINKILEKKTRVIVEKSFLFEKTVFQFQSDGVWVDYFKDSKFKI